MYFKQMQTEDCQIPFWSFFISSSDNPVTLQIKAISAFCASIFKLIGRDCILRVDVSDDVTEKNIELDDWKNSKELLPIAAEKAFLKWGKDVKDKFLYGLILSYKGVLLKI